jgi:hypothetical protein
MSLSAELKRRNVLRAAAFYAASAWFLVQIVMQVHIAEWVVRWIVVAAAIGLPFAMLDLRGDPRFEALVKKVIGTETGR